MTAQAAETPADTATLRDRLVAAVDGEVRFDAGTRAAYSTDASNYRQVPIGVVVPRTVDAGADAIAVCRDAGVPVVSRGGGTSLAGQCTNVAVMIDWVKYCNALVSVDVEARTAVVEPGIVLDDLNRRLAVHGLEYGPRPATHPNCTLGGMIGNNSCGATAQRTGKVADNIRRLDVITYDGTRFWCGPTDDEAYAAIEHRGDPVSAIYRRLRRLRDEYADDIRAGYPDIPRRVSGYNLDSLLPENGFDVAGLLVGSESTLVTVLRAEIDLVPVLPEEALVMIGYDTVDLAADDVPTIVRSGPVALEGLDRRLIHDEYLEGLNSDALDDLPEGNAFLMVQYGARTRADVDDAVRCALDDLSLDRDDARVAVLDDPSIAVELWRVREAGLGATAHVPGHRETWEGWEDSAVPPDRLGDYLRDLQSLYVRFGYAGETAPSLYGHFGQGCVHTRIPFDLFSADGVRHFREFLVEAAGLVTRYGGSLSGEHGDGQARGELLSIMFPDRVVEAFGALKHIFDPEGRMNPGKIVDPNPVDSFLRLGAQWYPKRPSDLHFGYPGGDGSFVSAANRCVGVGKCRQTVPSSGSVMCPSYQVTGEEEHSTRGRSRLLFEMLDGHSDGVITDGWRSTEVRDALDLCLSCKGCKSDCPVNVDMATYKAEFLSHHYAHRLRPRAHYVMGWLPLTGAVIGRARLGALVNAATGRETLARLATRLGGLEDRSIPRFARRTLQQWWRRRGTEARGSRGTVLLWPDTFTNRFHPDVGRAAVRVMEDAGWTVDIPGGDLCCGLTWISTGQLGIAEVVLRRTISRLATHLRSGGLIVGLEPSCTAVFRSDAVDLLGEDELAVRLREQTVTLAELLHDHTPGWAPNVQAGTVEAIVQTHCHQHAVMGVRADRAVMSDVGIDATYLDSGCCGLAGNFGFEPGHKGVSIACAEQALLPAIRDAGASTQVLADGFSCRTQIAELADGREGRHLAQLLADRIVSGDD
ncbi:FAD-binding and (Fe-S)-binding domain-containing protein [Gordonia liuliyuniae]|uniref:FAD-binding oxidoreductase n=1 Tax=Gordonia liuliyuniae TaxID=2911517 RepID=A0ABS9IQJ0_9ACTN|nr:FAD-binding and (Fe-S)-binding domain-containing protein [Gordonia liuliyuniae]MCF8587820.1 FAD-binding oxidoreductase [Gordonia liuliyuniae]